jgi:hypothetical protein
LSFLLLIPPKIGLTIKAELTQFYSEKLKNHSNNSEKLIVERSQKVNFEVFSCPGMLKIYLTTKQLASAFPNKKEQW